MKFLKILLTTSSFLMTANVYADSSAIVPYSFLNNGELHGFVVTNQNQPTVRYQGPICLNFPSEVPARAFIAFRLKAELISGAYTPVSYVYKNGNSQGCTFNFNSVDGNINVQAVPMSSQAKCSVSLANNLLLLNVALA